MYHKETGHLEERDLRCPTRTWNISAAFFVPREPTYHSILTPTQMLEKSLVETDPEIAEIMVSPPYDSLAVLIKGAET
jgi:hypothetical protein